MQVNSYINNNQSTYQVTESIECIEYGLLHGNEREYYSDKIGMKSFE